MKVESLVWSMKSPVFRMHNARAPNSGAVKNEKMGAELYCKDQGPRSSPGNTQMLLHRSGRPTVRLSLLFEWRIFTFVRHFGDYFFALFPPRLALPAGEGVLERWRHPLNSKGFVSRSIDHSINQSITVEFLIRALIWHRRTHNAFLS